MKRRLNTHNVRAVGLVKVLIVVAAVLVLVIIAFGFLVSATMNNRRICCTCNLKQVGLAARMWSNDHGELFPWDVPMQGNGVKEIAMSGNIAAICLVMSNELNSTKILFCPADKTRSQQTTWAKLSNANISYFLSLDAKETEPQTILSGDRNISGGILSSNRVMTVWSTNVLVWGADVHSHRGNFGLGDGSVQQAYDRDLQRQVAAHLRCQGNRPDTVARLALP